MSTPNTITFKGNPLHLTGTRLVAGQAAPDFVLHRFEGGLKRVTLSDLRGKALFISVVPSLDTSVCAIQTRKFNEQLSSFGDKAAALTVSADLPFAMNRFCGAEGIKNLTVASDYWDRNFGHNWGLLIEELRILARSTFVVDGAGKLTYVEVVPEMTSEPNYDAALAALKAIVG